MADQKKDIWERPSTAGWCFPLHQGPALATRWGKFLKRVLMLKYPWEKEIEEMKRLRKALEARHV